MLKSTKQIFGKLFLQFIFILFLLSSSSIAQVDWITNPGEPVIDQYDDWDSVVIHARYVLKDNDGYHLWFLGSNDSLSCGAVTHHKVGYAFSLDSENWTVHSEPVLEADPEYSEATINDVSVQKLDDQFIMWYTYLDGTTSGDVVGVATSSDGINWNKYIGNPVLVSGTDAEDWDYNEIHDLRVIYNDGTFRMWYTGYDIDGISRIGYTTSSDGYVWNKYSGNPVLDEDCYPGTSLGSVFAPNVFKDGSQNYKATFGILTATGKMGRFYAYSYNGIHWQPILIDSMLTDSWFYSNIIREDTAFLSYAGYLSSLHCDSLDIGPIHRRLSLIDTSANYFPVQTGNIWLYATSDSGYFYMEIGAPVSVYDSIEQQYFDGYEMDCSFGLLYLYYNNGIWVWYDPSGTMETPSYVRLKEKLLIGDSWLDIGNYFNGPDDTTFYRAVKDTSLFLPSGDFEARHVINDRRLNDCENLWFTNGIGLVRREDCDHSDSFELKAAIIDGVCVNYCPYVGPVFHVSTTGSDETGNGSEFNPFATIQFAVNMAGLNDTVMVHDGTYTGEGNRDIDFHNYTIVLISENGPEYTIIDCEGVEKCAIETDSEINSFSTDLDDRIASARQKIREYSPQSNRNNASENHRGFCFEEEESIVLSGFTIQGGYEEQGGGILCNFSSPVIENCIFSGNSSHYSGGGLFCYYSSPIVRDCIFKGNSTSTFSFGGGISLFGSSPEITGCLFEKNSAVFGGGLDCYFSSNPVLNNCTFFDNTANPASGILCETNSSPVFENCIIAFGADGEAIYCYDDYCYPSLSCCDVFGNTGGDWVDCIADQIYENGNIYSDPLFCDTANSDFQLAESSPCAPDNNPCGTLVGAYDIGCEAIVMCGDVNDDNEVNVLDILFLIQYKYWGGEPPDPLEIGDVNSDDNIDVLDILYLIDYKYKNGPVPYCPL